MQIAISYSDNIFKSTECSASTDYLFYVNYKIDTKSNFLSNNLHATSINVELMPLMVRVILCCIKVPSITLPPYIFILKYSNEMYRIVSFMHHPAFRTAVMLRLRAKLPPNVVSTPKGANRMINCRHSPRQISICKVNWGNTPSTKSFI